MTLAAPMVHLVDDDASFLKSISRLLRASRFSVAAFDSASELLEHLSAESRGCIVADLNMPGLSGLDLQARATYPHRCRPCGWGRRIFSKSWPPKAS